MPLERAEQVIQIYSEIQSGTWAVLSSELSNDYLKYIGARLAKHSPIGVEDIRSMHACELFSDDSPPRLLIAENEMDTHEDLRAKHPSSETRVSGNIITIGNFGCKFIVLDPVQLKDNIRKLPTEKQLKDVVPWLISQNIVPLDSEMQIISS